MNDATDPHAQFEAQLDAFVAQLKPKRQRDLGPYTRVFTARKEHSCSRCKRTIEPGEDYVRDVSPAWWDAEADADDEGRTIYSLLPKPERHFRTRRFCTACQREEYW